MYWLFDFDLTLYGYDEEQILSALDRNISRYVMKRLELSESAADALRREYWEIYGTTLNGLRALHGVKPEEYFDFIHSGEDLVAPRFAPDKRDMLLQLPGKRWVFTNARRDWAERGLHSMGLAECFEGILDIELFDWKSKPDPSIYAAVEHQLGASGSDLVLVDDRAANLAPARQLGWRTVFVHPQAEAQSVECDLKIAHLMELEQAWEILKEC